MLANIYWK